MRRARSLRLPDVLVRAGPAPLTDRQVLEIVLSATMGPRAAADAARILAASFGDLAAILTAPPAALREAAGLCPDTVAVLRLVRDCGVRLTRGQLSATPVLNSWDRLLDYLHATMARESEEQFRVLFLDARNRLLADEVLGRGTANHVPAYPREVARRALELRATALIIAHNHPSGDPTPSRADHEMTREIQRATEPLGIAIHDHIIVGLGQWVSFRQQGRL